MSARLSIWLNAVTATALAVAVGMIVTNRAEPAKQAQAVTPDGSQQVRLDKLERELHAVSVQPRSGESDPIELAARIESLKRELAMLSKAPSSTVEPTATVDAIEQERQEYEYEQQAIAKFEAVLAREPADASGSTATAAEISGVLQGPAFEKTIVNGVQCGTTVCRIDVSHADPRAAMQFNVSLNQLEAFRDSEGFVQQLPRSDGGVDIVTYVSRARS